MRPQLGLLGPILGLVLLVGSSVSLESAPALVWSSQSRSPELPVRFSTLVDQIEPNDLLAEYAQSKVPIVAFVQKDLSVEQFAANDAPFVAQLFDNLQMNPVLYTNVKNPRTIYSSFKTDASAASENIVVYLPGKTLKENDDFIKSYTEKLNASGPVIFMLTGENNEYLKTNKRSTRQVKADPKPLYDYSPKDDPCLLVYTKGASVTLFKKDSKDETQLTFDTAALEPVTCDKDKIAEGVELKFSNSDTTKKEVLTLTLGITASNLTGWTFTSAKIDIGGSYGDFMGNPKSFPTIDTRFSFSCQKTIIPLVNGTTVEYDTGILDIEAFQMQPFFDSKNWDKKPPRFTDSSDCAVWFTMPIWTGLIVSLILIAILYSGVVALMSIITPDRFENPKGRGLIITNVEE